MKRISVFFCIIFLISCNRENNFVNVKTINDNRLVIDGVKEKIWEISKCNQVSCITFGEAYLEDNEDMSVTYSVLYDSVNIYFFFEVTDNIKYSHNIPTNKFDKKNWHPEDYDNITILFDLDKDKKIDYKKISGDSKIGFNYNINRFFSRNIADIDGIDFCQRNTSTGYNFEIKIPLNALKISSENKKIGFCVRASDNDKRFVTPPEMDMLGGRETVIVWPNIAYFKDYYKCIGFVRFE